MLFGSQHLEMWAVGASTAYHLHVPKLYGKVVTKKCSVKVNQARRCAGRGLGYDAAALQSGSIGDNQHCWARHSSSVQAPGTPGCTAPGIVCRTANTGRSSSISLSAE